MCWPTDATVGRQQIIQAIGIGNIIYMFDVCVFCFNKPIGQPAIEINCLFIRFHFYRGAAMVRQQCFVIQQYNFWAPCTLPSRSVKHWSTSTGNILSFCRWAKPFSQNNKLLLVIGQFVHFMETAVDLAQVHFVLLTPDCAKFDPRTSPIYGYFNLVSHRQRAMSVKYIGKQPVSLSTGRCAYAIQDVIRTMVYVFHFQFCEVNGTCDEIENEHSAQIV